MNTGYIFKIYYIIYYTILLIYGIIYLSCESTWVNIKKIKIKQKKKETEKKWK